MESTDVTEAHILDERWVDLGLGQGLLQQSVHHVVQLGVLEAAFARLGQRSAQGEGDDDIIGVLLSAVSFVVSLIHRSGESSGVLHGVESTAGTRLEVAQKRAQTVCSHGIKRRHKVYHMYLLV